MDSGIVVPIQVLRLLLRQTDLAPFILLKYFRKLRKCTSFVPYNFFFKGIYPENIINLQEKLAMFQGTRQTQKIPSN